MRANAPNQMIAAKAPAESLLSPEDLKKERNKQNNKNLRERQKLTKQIADAEQQIEDWKRKLAKVTLATPRKNQAVDTPPHKGTTL